MLHSGAPACSLENLDHTACIISEVAALISGNTKCKKDAIPAMVASGEAAGAASTDVASVDDESAEEDESAGGEPAEPTSSRVALTPLPSVLRSAVWMRLRVVAFTGARPTPVRL